jgi:adenosylhomocysteine nucleosidase
MIAIIAAMEKELTVLRAALEPTETLEIADKTFFVGRIGKVPVVLARSGIGKVNAAVTTALLLDRFPVECLINTGIAGGVSPTRSGDIVVSTDVAYSDVDLRPIDPEMPFGQMEGEPLSVPADSALIREAETVLREERIAFRSGTIVSGDQFVTSISVLDPIRRQLPHVIACEMEGMAVAVTARHFRVPFVILRGISDVVDAPGQVQDYQALSQTIADRTTKFLLRFLSRRS